MEIGKQLKNLGRSESVQDLLRSPQNPPNKHKTFTQQFQWQEALASRLHPPTQGPNSSMWGIHRPQEHPLPGPQLHTITSSSLPTRNMLHALLCGAAGVHGRITSRQHLVSTLVRIEVMFVLGQAFRLSMRALGRWPAAASIKIRQRQHQGAL